MSFFCDAGGFDLVWLIRVCVCVILYVFFFKMDVLDISVWDVWFYILEFIDYIWLFWLIIFVANVYINNRKGVCVWGGYD